VSKRIFISYRASERASPDTSAGQAREEGEVVPLMSSAPSWKYGVNEEDVQRALHLALTARRVRRADQLLKRLDEGVPDSSEVTMESEGDDHVAAETQELQPAVRSAEIRRYTKEKQSTRESAMSLMSIAQNRAMEAFKESEQNIERLNSDLETAKKNLQLSEENSRSAKAEAAKAARESLEKAVAATQAAAERREQDLREELRAEADRATETAVKSAIEKAKTEALRLFVKILVIGVGSIGAVAGVAHWVGLF
jgi:hypothetical protein